MLSFKEIKKLPDSEWREHLKTLSMDQLFELAHEGIADINRQVEEMGQALERGFEHRLETDTVSKEAMKALLAKVSS